MNTIRNIITNEWAVSVTMCGNDETLLDSYDIDEDYVPAEVVAEACENGSNVIYERGLVCSADCHFSHWHGGKLDDQAISPWQLRCGMFVAAFYRRSDLTVLDGIVIEDSGWGAVMRLPTVPRAIVDGIQSALEQADKAIACTIEMYTVRRGSTRISQRSGSGRQRATTRT